MLFTSAKLLSTRTTTMTRQAEKKASRWWGVVAVCGGLLLGASGAQAAVVTISDCAADPHIVEGHGGRVTIDVGADDLVLTCVLVPPGPSSTLSIRGHDVSIQADVKFPGRPVDGIVVSASGKLEILGATIEASNNNASIRLDSAGDLTFRRSGVQAGVDVYGLDQSIQCTGQGCGITVLQSRFAARNFSMVAVGDVYFGQVKVVTTGPPDSIDIVSQTGSATISGCGNVFRSGTGGKMRVQACGQIDLAFASIDVADVIDIETTGTCGGLADIRLAGATVRNDFGKTGDIVVTAAGGAQTIDIGGATLIDDDRTSMPDVAQLNGRSQLPHQGFNNVVGTPDLDD
jgi:hypothetical protein